MSAAAPVTAFLSLGANLGDTLSTLRAAVRALDEHAGVAVIDVSAVYRTPPWPPPGDPRAVAQDDFHNLVVRVTTTLAPEALLDAVQAVERRFGRDRATETRWGPRPLDIDVLLYGDVNVDTPRLTIPHPHVADRAFVLVGLLEVFPGGALPDGRRVAGLLLTVDTSGIEFEVRFDDVAGRIDRPSGPAGPPASFDRPRVDDVARRHGRRDGAGDGP